MIQIEALRQVKTVVSHANCPDGVASALILAHALFLAHALPGVRVLFMQYGTADLAALKPEPGMLFVDFSPPAERAAEFRAKGAIVLDHHKTARAVVESFGERGVFADEEKEPGVSGAMLAYREVWCPIGRAELIAAKQGARPPYFTAGDDVALREFAILAGIRDTWQKNSPRWIEACAQAEALRFWPWERLRGQTIGGLASMLRIGDVLLERKAEDARRAIAESLRVTIGGKRIVILADVATTSDAAEALGDEADVVIGFRYLVDRAAPRPEDVHGIGVGIQTKMVLSCRSRGGFDVSAFCRSLGGGGHTAAAGCSLPIDAISDAGVSVNPYESICRCLAKYLGEKP
jgi:hypothetical protein